MQRVLLIVLLSLAACAVGVARTDTVSSGPRAWQLPTGRTPSQVEYAALVAACRDRAHGAASTGRIDACLSGDYDLRRTP